MRSMRFLALLATLGITAGLTRQATAAADSSATISTTSTASPYSYSLTLNNDASSTVPIQTFWFAWIPGKDYLATSPLSVTNPAGWNDTITHGGSTDGYGIQWVASSSAFDVTAGTSLSGFGFSSIDAPTDVAGNSIFYTTTPVLTSFTYSSTPVSGTSEKFVVAEAAVPEPTTLAILTPAALMMLRRRRRSV